MDFQKITSAQNPKLKYVEKLQAKNRFRNEEDKIILEGFHLLEEIIAHDQSLIESVFVDSRKLQNAESKILNKLNVPIYILQNDLIAKISSTQTTTGLVTVAKKTPEKKSTQQNLVLFIENLQDPGNLGTILRSSAAAGVDEIFIDKKSVDIWSSKVLRAGMGSHFKIKITLSENLEKNIQDFPGTTYVTVMNGQNLFKTSLPQQTGFVIGNEGSGVSVELQEKTSHQIHIPMQSEVESLNASTATTLCVYEYYRQHLD